MKQSGKKIISNILVWVGLAVLAILFFEVFGNSAQDDAFISFRYAKNIALGKGFVYNDGEWVLGTTTPLYTLVLAAAATFTKLDILRISIVINTISLWLAAGCFYELTKSADKLGAVFLSCIFITSPFLRNFIGMESYFLLFLLLLTIYLFQKENFGLAGFVNGLLVLVRYEMIFLSLIFFVWEVWKRKKFPVWMISGGVLVVTWLIYAAIMFGSPIPLSASAKLAAPKHSFLLGGAAYLYLLIDEYPAAIFIILFAVIGLGHLLNFRKLPYEYIIIFLFSGLYFIAASLTAGAFPWYYAPLLPAFSLLILFGIKATAEPPVFFTRGWPLVKKHQTVIILRNTFFLLLLCIQLIFLGKNYKQAENTIGDNRYTGYKQIAEIIVEDSDPQPSIASFEIGYLGYYSDSYIIDIAGLITPGLLPWVGKGAEETIYHAIRLYEPDYVVVPCGNQLQVALLENSKRYQLESKFEGRYCLYKYDLNAKLRTKSYKTTFTGNAENQTR